MADKKHYYDLTEAIEIIEQMKAKNERLRLLLVECRRHAHPVLKGQIDAAMEAKLGTKEELFQDAIHPHVSQAAVDVLTERRRQVEAEGWTPEHDDEHSDGQMAVAAGYYALACGYPHERDIALGIKPDYWPWDKKWWKPKDSRSNLLKAGALILAEIERLDRADSPGDATAPELVERDARKAGFDHWHKGLPDSVLIHVPSARRAWAAAVAASRPPRMRRQYYFRVTECAAKDPDRPDCICWHDEGAGPLASEPHRATAWRITCGCGYSCPEALGKYGCPNCASCLEDVTHDH